jgi:hypothetical protein
MKSLIIHFGVALLSLLIISCSGDAITGKWKMAKSRVIDTKTGEVIEIYIANPEAARKTLLAQSDNFLPSPEYTGEDVKADVDRMVEKHRNAGFELFEDGRLFMVSNGIILPRAVPGWHFGDSLVGTWQRKGDTLRFEIGDFTDFDFRYIILDAGNKKLKLRQAFGDASESIFEMEFAR